MNTLEFIKNKFNLDLDQKSPIAIPTCFRKDMAQTLNELNFKTGVEVGTWDGEHAEILCENIPDLELYCIDPWVTYSGYKDYHTNDYPGAIKKTRDRLKNYNVHIIKKFSMDAVNSFNDRSLDFVYIDANHDFRHVIEDVDEWRKKVKRGGIIFGHDFKRSRPSRWLTNQVYYAVAAYAYANRINPWFTLGVEKLELKQGNGVRSWMWVC